jgi:hypothetical protein
MGRRKERQQRSSERAFCLGRESRGSMQRIYRYQMPVRRRSGGRRSTALSVGRTRNFININGPLVWTLKNEQSCLADQERRQ